MHCVITGSRLPKIAEVRLVDFKRILESNLGTDAITRVHVESTDGEQTWGTVGVSDNVITASWEAIDSVSTRFCWERILTDKFLRLVQEVPIPQHWYCETIHEFLDQALLPYAKDRNHFQQNFRNAFVN